MIKTTLRIALTPAILIVRLLLGLTAFITSIASSILGLTVSLFALLSLVEFFIGYRQNGIAFLVLALLVSPIGLTAAPQPRQREVSIFICSSVKVPRRSWKVFFAKSTSRGDLCSSQIAAFHLY